MSAQSLLNSLSASALRRLALFVLLFMLSAFVALAQVTNLGDCSIVASFPYGTNAGVAVDPQGNVFATIAASGLLYEISPGGTVTPVSLQGYTLNSPAGMALDSAGNLYIADTKNNRVLEVAVGGTVSPVNLQGNSLLQPMAVAVDAAGDLFIADSGNSRVLEVAASNGPVTTVKLGTATPKLLQGVAVSADGNTVYIASYGGGNGPFTFVDEIANVQSSTPQVTPVSMAGISPGFFSSPQGMTVDAAGNLYIADAYLDYVLKVTPAGVVTVAAQYSPLCGIIRASAVAVDSGGTIYAPDPLRDNVWRFAPSSIGFGPVALGATSAKRTVNFTVGANTVLGTSQIVMDGGATTEFSTVYPTSCTPGTTGSGSTPAACKVVVTFTPAAVGTRSALLELLDNSSNIVATMPLYGTGTAPMPVFPTAAAQAISFPSSATPGPQSGVSADNLGNIYVADSANSQILKISSGVTTVVPVNGETLSNPSRVVSDESGNLFIADTGNNRIIEVPASEQAATLVPTSSLTLSSPNDLAIDAAGNLFVADTGNDRIVGIPIYGSAYVVYPGPTPISAPAYIAVDDYDNLYFTENRSNALFTIPNGSVAAEVQMTMNASGPSGVAVDAGGTIYLADSGGSRLLEIDNMGNTMVAPAGTLTLSSPVSIAVDAFGNLTFSDRAPNLVATIARGTPPQVTFQNTGINDLSNDSPQNTPIVNGGNAALTLANIAYPAQFLAVTGVTNSCSTGESLGPAGNCILPIGFQPTTLGPIAGSLVLTDNALNTAGTMQTIGLNGVAGQDQTISFALSPNSVQYGVEPFDLSPMASASSSLAVSFSVKSGPGAMRGTVLNILGAGTIVIAADQLGNSTYGAAPTVLQSITVTPAPLTVTAVNASRVYGQANPSFGYNIAGFVNGDSQTTATSGAPAITTTATVTSSVGNYPIDISAGTLFAANYTFNFVNGNLAVTPANLSVIAASPSKTYGQANPTLGYTMTGFVNNDTQASATTGAPNLTTSATASSPVGVYPIDIAAGSLLATNYTFVFTNGTLTVTPASLSVTASSLSKTYGQANPTLGYTITGFQNNDTQSSATTGAPLVTTTATTSSPVGAYPVNISVGTLMVTTNYTVVFTNGVLTVNPATLTVTATNVSRPYGGPAVVLGYNITGFVNGDTQTTAVQGFPTLTINATLSSPVGIYTVNISQGSLKATNYGFTFVNGNYTITQAPLTVTINSLSKIYGAALPTFGFKITAGLKNGDQTSVLTGTPVYQTAATQASPVGHYPIDATVGSLTAANYSVIIVPGTLSVTPATLTVTANNASRVYGAPLVILSYNFTGFVNGDTHATAVQGFPALLATGAQPSASVGAYPIVISQGSLTAANYVFTFVNGTYTITPAPLNLIATSFSQPYGTTSYTLKFTISGLVNGDSQATAFTGTPKLTCTVTATTPVGPYPIEISAGTVKSTNYTPAWVNGTLTVTQKTMKVVVGNGDGIYGSSPRINQKGYTLEGFVNGDTAKVLSGEATLTTTAELSSPVGAYPIVYKEGSLTAKNYALVGVNGSYTVEKATLTFTAKNESMKKGSSLPKLADSVTGLVNGDTDAKAFTGTPALSTTASSKSSAGKYPIDIKQGSLESKNYAFKFVDGTLTITD